MKKFFVTAVVAVFVLLTAVGCGNRQLLDMTHKFDRAILRQADGTIVSGEVESWTDFDDGDQIQVKIDGKTYLVHSSQITLIAE